MRTNTKNVSPPVYTHEGGRGAAISPALRLRRLCMTALLFEKQFYQSGTEHSKLVMRTIDEMVGQYGLVDGITQVVNIAIECREKMYLRHMPLFLLAVATQYKGLGSHVAHGLSLVIKRPDELGEFIAIYAKMYPEAVRTTVDYRTGQPSGARKGVKLSAGAKRGLAAAFRKFNAYSLAKYNRDTEYKLTDVLRLVKPKPMNVEQSATWKQLIAGTLASPDTWEVALSAGGSKKEVFERLLTEDKMGGLAFLRNLRNMEQSGVSLDLMRARFKGKFDKVLPYRFIAAMKHAPSLASELDEAMLRSTANLPKLPGHTAIIVDVSGSMSSKMSTYSEMNRMDAACALAVIVRELTDSCQVFTFSDNVAIVPSHRGLSLRDNILNSQPHRNTHLSAAMNAIGVEVQARRIRPFDRVIVITDEQTHDGIGQAGGLGYVVNVGADAVGVGYPNKGWVHIDGFSDRIVDFIYNHEQIATSQADGEDQ